MTKPYEDELIIKAIRWTAKAGQAIQDASGAVEHVLSRFPDDLLITMVRNSLELNYNKKNKLDEQDINYDASLDLACRYSSGFAGLPQSQQP